MMWCNEVTLDVTMIFFTVPDFAAKSRTLVVPFIAP